MNSHNDEVKKCKLCGKTIVGKNKTGICNACKKASGDKGLRFIGALTVISGTIYSIIKSISKKD